MRVMHEIRDRSEQILFAAISEFIRSGEPVSSKLLFNKYGFGISPASIRSELNTLEEGGWLSQIHTSGGRVPTDKAYERYAARVRERLDERAEPSKSMTALAEALLGREFDDFLGGFADEVKALSAGYSTGEGRVIKSGLDELFGQLPGESADIFRDMAKEIETLDRRMEDFFSTYSRHGGLEIFVGEKNPFVKSEHVSAVFDSFDVDGEAFFLLTIGPKRMNYEHSCRAFLGVKKAMHSGHGGSKVVSPDRGPRSTPSSKRNAGKR